MLFSSIIETRVGHLALIFDEEKRIYGLTTPSSKATAVRFTQKTEEKPFPAFKKDILRYFNGKDVDFSRFKLNLDGFTDFQQAVYKALRATKAGQLITYGDLAMKAGKKGAARAVGTAMKLNRIPIIIPCHRVIRSNGNIGEYSAEGGIKMKLLLMGIESDE